MDWASEVSAATGSSSLRKVVASSPQHVAEVVERLAWSVRDTDELVQYLQRCVDVAVRVIEGAACAGVTTHLAGEPLTAVCTDAETLLVDSHQYEAGDGPCLLALRTGEVVRADVATSRERWPRFVADAERAGVRSFLAAPLGTAQVRLGALNVYGRDAGGFSDHSAELVHVIVAHAARTIEDYTRLHAAEELAAQLRVALASRAPIEQAKGMLMAEHRITADEAFDLLRRESQTSNVRLQVVATAYVAASSQPVEQR